MSFGNEMKDFISAYGAMSDAHGRNAATRKMRYETGELYQPSPGRFRDRDNPNAPGGGTGGGVGTRDAPAVDPATGGGKGSGGSGKMSKMPNRGGDPFLNYTYNYYRSKGIGHNVAAGIAGNLQQESGGDPRVFAGVRRGDNGTSAYAAQWRGDRLTNLEAFAADRGHPKPTMQDQFDFVLEEGDPSSPYADKGAIKAFDLMNASGSVSDSAAAFMRHFERAKEGPTSNLAGRIKWAESLEDIGGSGPGSGSGGEVVARGAIDTGEEETLPAIGSEDEPPLAEGPAMIDVPAVDTTTSMETPEVAMQPDPYAETGLYADGGAIPDDTMMFKKGGSVSQADFDAMVRREEMRGSAGRSTGDSARDAVARRINMRERGISSSAFKPVANVFPKAPKAPATGGSRLPKTAPTPTPRPGTGGEKLHVRHPDNPRVGKGTSRSPELSAMTNMGGGSKPKPKEDEDGGKWGKPVVPWVSDLKEWWNKETAPKDKEEPKRAGDDLKEWMGTLFRKGGAIPDDQGVTPRIGRSQRDADSGSSGYTTRARRDEKGRRTLALPPKTKAGRKLKAKPLPGREAGKPKNRRPQGATPSVPKKKPASGAELRPSTFPARPDVISDNKVSPKSTFPARPETHSDNKVSPKSTFPARPDKPGSNLRPGGNLTPQRLRPIREERERLSPLKPERVAGKDITVTSTFDARPEVRNRNVFDRPPMYKKGPGSHPPAKVGPGNTMLDDILENVLPKGGALAAPVVILGTGDRYKRGGPVKRYARGGAIPDDEGPPNPPAGDGDRAPLPANQGAGPWGASLTDQPATGGSPNFREVAAKAQSGVALGFEGLSRIFAGDSGAMPSPEGGAMTSSAAERFAHGEGAATDEEVAGIDNHSGIDTVDADEGTKDLMRIDYVVNYWLERGYKDKGEAAAASLMMRGSTEVKRAGKVAAAALATYQETGDPKDLQNASEAIKRANSIIPDGINLQIDIDPQTHAVLATVIDADGKEQTHEVDPAAVPELLQDALTGSAYWKAVWQIGHPALAQQEMSDDAAAGRSIAKSAREQEAEWAKDAREEGQEQDRWERNAKFKLWEHDRDSAEGRDADARTKVADDAFYTDWNERLAAAAEGSPERQQILTEGLQYRYQNTPTRKDPLTEDFAWGVDSQFNKDGANAGMLDEDLASIQKIARALTAKNIQLEASDAMEMAASLIVAPEGGITNEPDGTLSVDEYSLVFNPQLLPLLGQLRKKYRPQE